MRWGLLAVFVLLVSAVAAPTRAQISPGELSRAHALLDGSTQCLKCHESGRGVAADKCLSCHQALSARLTARQGLHARPGHQECARCHIEHHGRDFELVFWGKEGREAFDHRQTGLALEGAHARLRCDQCHQPRRIPDPGRWSQGGANLQRTFLGLSRECGACHVDVHRGRFAPTSCHTCHTQDAWRPAPGFDHARTRFPLVGEHEQVACDRCHAADPQTGPRRLAGLAFDSCKSCHADPHAGRLGASCATCHSPQGWRVMSAGFDHDRTAFPLTGAHRQATCNECHKADAATGRPRFRGTAFQSCTACHRDPHAGRLGQSCTTCHTTQSWKAASASFDHTRTGYPLRGRHAQVKCGECHGPGRPRSPPHAACTDCHADHHLGQLAHRADGGRCDACHDVDGFERPRFGLAEHEKSAFPLTGAHRAVACDECHRKVPAQKMRVQLCFPATSCTTCHRDPHEGRFARDGTTSCVRCHQSTRWTDVRFDHDRETRFPLAGAHARVACTRCHRDASGAPRYRGLPLTCAGCHRAAP